MTMPNLRKRVYVSLDGKNISLDDLRGSSYPGIEVVSVEPVEYNLHNTKVILKVEPWVIDEEPLSRLNTDGVLRSCLYDRIDIREIVPEDLIIPVLDIQLTLQFFKDHGFDFTEDDIEIVDWKIKAKSTSLGYFGNLDSNDTVGGNYLVKENSTDRVLLENGNKILI